MNHFAFKPPGQVCSGKDIPPLVVAAHLDAAIVFPEEMPEIVGLEEHVIKFYEIEPGLQTNPVTFRCQHSVYAEVAADISEEIDVANEILNASETAELRYVRDKNENISGIALYSVDRERSMIFVAQILTTNKTAFKEFVKLLDKDYFDYAVTGQRWKGLEKKHPKMVTYKSGKLSQLVLKGE